MRGLELLEFLPTGSKRDKQELSLQLALAPIYRVTKGWAALELERVLDRALALCDTNLHSKEGFRRDSALRLSVRAT